MFRDPLRLLVVEDNPGDVDLVRTYLEGEPLGPIEIAEASSLQGAREKLAEGSFDLVLLDLGLPDGQGVEVISKVREMSEDVPIVVLTGRGDTDLGIQAVRLDAQDYLRKDQLTASSLSRAIRHAVERHRWQDRHRHQLNMSPDGIIVVDADATLLFANQAATHMLGRPRERLNGSVMVELLARREPGGVELDTGRIVELRSVDTDWHNRLARLITMRDITDRVRAEQQLRAVTEELQRSNERLEELATADPLTKVLNRRGIERTLRHELDRVKRFGDSLMGVLVDIDDFKRINDSFGHAVGDAALTAFTESVRGALRSGDHVGRVGGDEFLVILPGTTAAESIQVSDKLRRAIKATTVPVASETVVLSASLAVGPIATDVVSIEEVLATLHYALRNSKRGGKDRVSMVGLAPGGIEQGARELALVDGAMLNADSIKLDVVYQGIQKLSDESLMGFEALTRGPPGEFASPADLFRAAFEQDVLTTVDLRALRAILDRFKLGTWDCWYHLNLFPSTVINTAPDQLTALLVDAGIDKRVCIEISEQQFLGDPNYLRLPIENLRRAGFRVAIDDVGFGRSSIEALMVLEPDVVKIDRKCIHTMGKDAGERRQLERLIAMLRAVEATVIVEGVETREELLILRDMGVLYAQGFLWGRPAGRVASAEPAKRPA